VRLRRGGLPLAQGRAGEAVGSLLLGSTTTTARSSTSAVAAQLQRRERRELVEFLAPYRETALAKHVAMAVRIGKEAGVATRRTEATRRAPAQEGSACRRKEPLERRKDLSWEPLRPELVVEVAYDHNGGRRASATPAHYPALATRQAAARVHLRPARGRAAHELEAIFSSG
jgi:hypothetical protein